jgi:hypothetical protein
VKSAPQLLRDVGLKRARNKKKGDTGLLLPFPEFIRHVSGLVHVVFEHGHQIVEERQFPF